MIEEKGEEGLWRTGVLFMGDVFDELLYIHLLHDIVMRCTVEYSLYTIDL